MAPSLQSLAINLLSGVALCCDEALEEVRRDPGRSKIWVVAGLILSGSRKVRTATKRPVHLPLPGKQRHWLGDFDVVQLSNSGFDLTNTSYMKPCSSRHTNNA